MRNRFINHLCKLASKNKNIALVIGDIGYGVVEKFQKKFPDRFYNVGVAEQNMINFACGLASKGMHVFVYSIANFPTFRCLEQIRNTLDYHNFKVTIVSVGGGVAYGSLGYSHHAIQDYAIMRINQNLIIFAPSDPSETEMCLNFLTKNPGPSYFRLGKIGEKLQHNLIRKIYPLKLLSISKSKIKNLNIIISTGTALDKAKTLLNENKFKDYSLFTMPIWGKKYKPSFKKKFFKFKNIVTVEDHLQDGGFGSWVKESLGSENCQIKNYYLSERIVGMVGSQKDMSIFGSD